VGGPGGGLTGRAAGQKFSIGPPRSYTLAQWGSARASWRGNRFCRPADRFVPERFIDAKPPTRVWVPFGGGRHRCLGDHFGLLENKLILHTVLRRVELEAADQRAEPVKRRAMIAHVPAHGCRVVVTRRSPRDPAASDRAAYPVPDAPGVPAASATSRSPRSGAAVPTGAGETST
jgi:hypothetical protein